MQCSVKQSRRRSSHMDFWGVEIKVVKTVQVEPGADNVIQLSEACHPVTKESEKEPVRIYANTGNQKLCIGTLSTNKYPQLTFDLIFDKKFEVSHTSKSGSVHLYGYKGKKSELNSEETDTAKTSLNEAQTGNAITTEHKNTEVLEPSREVNHDSDISDAFDSPDVQADNDTSESDKEAQIKASQGSKREKDSSIQVPVRAKKAKLVTSPKTDAKNSGGHIATPHPSKHVAKTSGNSDKSK